jgi:PAS domain S-box-containing protein
MSYLTYFQKTPALLQVVGADGRIADVSDEWLHFFDYERAAVIGQPYTRFITPESVQRVVDDYLPQLQAQLHLSDLACEFVHHSGTRRLLRASVAAERNSDGNIAHYLIVLHSPPSDKPADQLLTSDLLRAPHQPPADFLRTLVSHLTTTFHTRYALVTEVANPAVTRVRTLAYVDHQRFLDNLEYDLAGTPCAGVLAGSVCYYPAKLNTRFTMELGEEAYWGAPLLGAQGQIIGHLALLDDKPMVYSTWEQALLQNFTYQAGLALENLHLHRQVLHYADWQEHGQLARKLHDSVTQSLFSVTMLTAGWQRLLRNGQPIDPDSWLTELSTVSQQALRELRLMANELQPLTIEKK